MFLLDLRFHKKKSVRYKINGIIFRDEMPSVMTCYILYASAVTSTNKNILLLLLWLLLLRGRTRRRNIIKLPAVGRWATNTNSAVESAVADGGGRNIRTGNRGRTGRRRGCSPLDVRDRRGVSNSTCSVDSFKVSSTTSTVQTMGVGVLCAFMAGYSVKRVFIEFIAI